MSGLKRRWHARQAQREVEAIQRRIFWEMTEEQYRFLLNSRRSL